jgi:hypothetical protein
LYRQLFNEQLFLMAYGRIYANDGAMTPGVDGDTPDGMSLEVIRSVIGRLRAERYRFTPVRRSPRRTEPAGRWVCRHFPGEPKPGYINPWNDMPEWEQAAATAVYCQAANQQ